MATRAATPSPVLRERRDEAAAFGRRIRLAAGAAVGLHLLITFGLPRNSLPLTSLEPSEPEATQVELVGAAEEAPAPVVPPEPPPPPAAVEPPPKPEPPPPPKPDPENMVRPEPPPPKPPEQRPPPTPPKPRPQPVAEKRQAPAQTAQRPSTSGAAATSPPGTPGGAASAGDGKNTRPGYLDRPAPKYPRESEAAREHGTVLLSVEISAGGRPDSVKIEKSSGYERLDRAAVEAVRRWRFKPATREGQPVAARVNIPVQFKLP
jgi:protein TonB